MLIKFYGPSGESHFGQATITRTTSVNGGLSLTGEVFAGDDVLNGLDYGWWLNFDNEKYVITYKKLSDDTNTIVFDAVQQFFWDFSKVALHSQYTGSHEYAFYLRQLFNESGYTYKNDVTVPAFEKENWGYKNKLDLFNDIIDQAGVEFEVHNETVHIAKQIGSDLTSFARKGINLSDLTEEMKISDFATYARGYGAFKDAEDQSKGRLEVEYRSELAKQFGDLEMDPIVDERYTIADNLIAALKKQVDATYTVSMTMNIYDLENAGYPNYEAPKVGDWILAIDEALNFKRKIRIIQLEEQFDVTGKRIGYTATCGDLSIVDQYTHLQSSLDSKVQRIQESVDNAVSSANGKSTNYYGAKEPVKANEGDLWFDQSNSDPDKWTIKQWLNGRWEQITLNPGEVDAKVDVAKQEAETAIENAKSASDKADQLAAKYDDTNALANQALDQAVGAQSDASIAVAKANSTASEFGKVDQKAESALASALGAQSDASVAVKQASSAAADSKDAKQIAGAVSQSYKTLTDGSTMTIAELESSLAVKLTKTDLDGYATQTWAQNQINVSANGINGTISSIKNTVDGQTTSINDLKADSSSFKSQFTTVNNTLSKQTTDIGTLQASSKELTSGFNTLTSDNTTNKNDISQLKQTATEFNSTLETVQTRVQNSAVGTNLLLGTSGILQTVTNASGWNTNLPVLTPAMTAVDSDTVYTARSWISPSSHDMTVQVAWKDAGGNQRYGGGNVISAGTSGYSTWTGTITAGSTIQYVTVVFVAPQSTDSVISYKEVKFEKGNVATDWCPNPADNATVTALSSLSQTVDGMQTDISKKIEQKDLNGYATETWTQSKIKITADGINGAISSVKNTVDDHTTNIHDIQADSKEFKSQFTTYKDTVDRHDTDISTLQRDSKHLSSNFDSLDSDNKTNQHNIGDLQQSAKEFSSTLLTVQNNAIGINLVSAHNWTTGPDGGGSPVRTMTHPFYNGLQPLYVLDNQTSNENFAYSPRFNLKPNTTYVVSLLGFEDVHVSSSDVFILARKAGETDSWTIAYMPIPGVVFPSDKAQRLASIAFTTGNDIDSGYIRIDNNGSKDGNNAALFFTEVKLQEGTIATPYTPATEDLATVTAVSSISQTVEHIQTTVRGKVDNDTYQSDVKQLSGQIESVVKKADDNFTAIQQTASDINLRVEKKGVINAVNVSSEGIQIYGNKLHITATTYIDDAIIKSAMIESLQADKIRTGTLDADKVDVIHLNAGNITAGTIRGTNLEIGLNTGNVEFQKGRIHSADNSIDININDRYISVADSSSRVMLKNGEMQFVQPGVLDLQTSPYFRIHNRGGLAFGGAEMVGRDYVTVSNDANSNDFFTNPLGVETFSGLFTGYNRATDEWRATKVGGAERGVIISGGSDKKDSTILKQSPSIIVGYNRNSPSLIGGNRILLDAFYVHSFSTYTNTTSQAPNVVVAQDGALVRSTSASKYKKNIVREHSSDYGKKLIQLPTATWIDKASVKRYNEDPSQPVPSLNYGMIAEDLADAGLEYLVVRNDEGELEGIQYDRIAVALLPLLSEWKQIIDNQEKEINELKKEQ